MSFSVYLGLSYLLQVWSIPEEVANVAEGSFLSSFNSKTAYRHSNLMAVNKSFPGLEQCKLVHVSALFRHGTRAPGADDMEEIDKLHKKIWKSNGRRNLPKSFVEWKQPFSRERAKHLSDVGFEEMLHLGRRFRRRLDKVVGGFDETKDMVVSATSVLRTRESAEAFLRKFMRAKRTRQEILDIIEEKDKELRFFDNCQFYTDSVKMNKTTKKEYKRFATGPEIQQAAKDIQNQWDLHDIELTGDDVRAIYIMCGYEIANNVSASMRPHMCRWNKYVSDLICPNLGKVNVIETSPLCSLLEPRHYPIFDYLYDLKHYWTKSYGSRINWIMACDLMSPMLDQISEAAEGHKKAYTASRTANQNIDQLLKSQNYTRAAFWFGHAETVIPLMALLNLFKQSSPMTASSFNTRLSLLKDPSKRFTTFRASNIAPFSGNIAVELIHCPHLVTENDDGYIIRVKSNEKQLNWSSRKGKEEVSLKAFKQLLELCSPQKYNHDAVCGKKRDDRLLKN